MLNLKLLLGIIAIALSLASIAQGNPVSQDTIKIPSKYLDATAKKSSQLEKQIDTKSQKALIQLRKEEARMKKKLSKIDSLAAKNVFANADETYKELEQKLKNPPFKNYIPSLDTLSTSLKLLQQNSELISQINDGKEKLEDALSKVKGLETEFQKAEQVKQFLKERKQFLKDQLSKLGFDKELKKINKNVYYYSAQLREYKEILNDPQKIERKVMWLLSQTKLFKDFFQKNSMLSSLFRTPGDPTDPIYQASLVGLQTRTQVNSLIQNQVTLGGPNAQQAFQQNLQQAQSQIQQLKDKINKWGGGSSDDILPEGFKPNNQKAKTFLQRVEVGSNFQTQSSRYMFPITTDLGLSLGYKLNDKSVIGIGSSYKMGWGTGWNNLRITHQGLSLRSFIDWKIKGSFWVSGGYEQNYRTEIRSIDQLRDQSAWQQSGLIGISKVVSLRSKLFKKTKAQLLWDFLSYQQLPKAQSIVFRLGYNF